MAHYHFHQFFYCFLGSEFFNMQLCPLRDGLCPRRIIMQLQDIGCHAFMVIDIHKVTRFLVNDGFRMTAVIRRNHRQISSHGFNQIQSQAFGLTGSHIDIRQVKQRRNVTSPAKEQNLIL